MTKIKQHWEKKIPYEDYSKTPDRVNSRINKVTHIIREARALGVVGKHAGSKPIEKLLQAIARAHEVIASSKQKEIQTAEEMKEGDEEI